MGLFSDLQKVFERAIGLYTELDQPARAFDISERSRARALLDSVSDRGEVSAEASEAMAVAELQPLLRADETVVAYHPLHDRLLVWMVGRERVRERSARKSVVSGKSVLVRVDLGCRRILKLKHVLPLPLQ